MILIVGMNASIPCPSLNPRPPPPPFSQTGCPPSGLPMLEAEVAMTRYVRDLPMPVTFIAGSFPFEYILSAAARTMDQRSHLVSLPLKSLPVTAVALSDVARAAAEVFCSPTKFKRQTIYLASEECKLSVYTDALGKVSRIGRDPLLPDIAVHRHLFVLQIGGGGGGGGGAPPLNLGGS